MGRTKSNTRRDFLKKSMGTAAVMMGGRLHALPAAPNQIKVINPDIDNLSVVCCHDPDMITGNPSRWDTIADQNETVDVDKVQDNIDRMAMVLAQKDTPERAWEIIFQKPADKEWGDVKVAFKVNCKTRSFVPKNNPRLAVLDKLCRALNGLGIPFENIILYDGDDEEASALYADYVGNGLPDGVIVSNRNDALGGRMPGLCSLPLDESIQCTKDIANGTIDILLNVSVNKGSHDWTGPVTVTLKNHYGTFQPDHSYGFDMITAINKSDAIVGGAPVRQQLCFVDSIWACTTGPSDPPNKAPHRLLMGTCSPIVDYLTIRKIREEIMGATHTESIIKRYVEDFGYTENEVTDLIPVDPDLVIGPVGSHRRSGPLTRKTRLRVSVSAAFRNATGASFTLPSTARPIFVNIHDLKGRRIRALKVSESGTGSLKAVWDGRGASGAAVRPGPYLATVIQNGRAESKRIIL